MKIPLIGLGTWELRGKECTDVVRLALDLGYRHIDTAHVYENHKAIAKAIHGFDRSKLFITSKLALDELDEISVQKAYEKTLKELGIDYLDLYLIHWPDRKYPLSDIFKAMAKLTPSGVSNFTMHHLQDLHRDGCKPKVNQVEFHPYLYQKELLDYCRLHHMALIAYRPLGKGKLHDPLFDKIGRVHQKSAQQIILRWLVQKGIPVIPKASSEKHLRENLEVLEFELTDLEMRELDGLSQDKRFCMANEPEFKY